MIKREWIAPGLVITALTVGANFVSGLAVDRYRRDQQEESFKELKRDLREDLAKSIGELGRRINKLDDRLDKMQEGSSEVVRLQERNRQLDAALAHTREELLAQMAVMRDDFKVQAMLAQKFREDLLRKGIVE